MSGSGAGERRRRATHAPDQRPGRDSTGGELALAVHHGERGAFERLVRAHQDALYGYALGLLGQVEDAQEVTQDAFLRAHRALTLRYDEERCRMLLLRPWLFRIAQNLGYNRLRARRSSQGDPLPAPDGYHEPALRSAATADGDVDRGQDARRLERALAKLPARSRELVHLRFVQDLAYAEIAAILGGTEAAARGRVFRALGELRAHLTNREACHAM